MRSSIFPTAAALLLSIPRIFGQTPPPEVDAALRARITKFYQAQIDGKPRLAEPLVAEESKDVFYAMSKPRILGFSIERIDYSENFTQAKASVMVRMHIPIAQLAKDEMSLAIPSLWKIENGEWCWYIDPDVLRTTPFGKMPSSSTEASGPAAVPDEKHAVTVEELWQKVKADKLFVVLRPSEASTDQVVILNQMPGPVKIQLNFPSVPGLEVVADRLEIPANEKAVVSFHFKPGSGPAPTRPVLGNVAVEPIHSVIPLRVVFR
jgi:hypothetical protein